MSDLGLCCLPMSHKKDARLIWVKGFEILGELSEIHYLNVFKDIMGYKPKVMIDIGYPPSYNVHVI